MAMEAVAEEEGDDDGESSPRRNIAEAWWIWADVQGSMGPDEWASMGPTQPRSLNRSRPPKMRCDERRSG